MSDMHELLPWYVNETLEPSETAAFERHLAACAECREELALLRKMRDRLEAHGDAPLSDHPSAQRLADVLSAGEGDSAVPAEEAAQVRRHLEVCLTCAEEAGWAAGAAQAIRASAAATARRETAPAARRPVAAEVMRRWVLPWGWAVAAALAIVVARGAFIGPGAAPGASGIQTLHTVEPVPRAGGEPAAVVVGQDAVTVHLVFPVDAAPASFPLRLEILDAAGKRVHFHEQVDAGDLSNGAFLFLSLRRADLPDGAYTAHLTSRDGRATATAYRFRVESR